MVIYKKQVPIYFGELVVVINNDLIEGAKKIGVTLDYDTTGCIALYLSANHNKTKKTRRIILLSETPTHGTIAHESLHCCNRILHDICHDNYDLINDEPAAYLLDWIVEHVYRACKKGNIEVKI